MRGDIINELQLRNRMFVTDSGYDGKTSELVKILSSTAKVPSIIVFLLIWCGREMGKSNLSEI